MADALYSRLNSRGRKQFKVSTKEALAERFPQYARLGLPAHKASLDGNNEGLQQIFASNADDGVPSLDVNGATPLHLAVRNNHVETVRWLLRFTDLSPLTPAKHGETPAHVAAAQGHLDCLKLLATAEGKGNLKSALATALDNPGFTPLHLAVVKNHNICAKFLISELGAKAIGPVTETGVTTVHVAASAGNVEVLKLLANKHKKLLDQDTSEGTTPVYFACQEGRVDALKFLHLKGSCSLTTPSSDGLKPIHAAAQCGHTNIVKYIVRELGNTAIFAATPDGATPLHFAASAGMVATATYLINSDVGGTLVSIRDENGDTPAHDAADNGQTKVLKLLLESGADLYAINADGNTPYSIALSGEHPETANFVMTYASGLPQREAEGSSRMTIRELSGKVDVVDFGAPVTAKPQKKEERMPGPPSLAKEKVLPVKKPSILAKEKDKEKKGKEKKVKEKKVKEKKGKEKKGKDKEKRTSSSFLGQTNPSLQSFSQPEATPTDPAPSSPVKKGADDKILELTDEELALFTEVPKQETEYPTSSPPPSNEESDIVVRYSTELDDRDTIPIIEATTQYSTVNEIVKSEDRKERKRSRLSSKSIQSAMKPSQGRNGADMSEERAFSGPELGFKPQFRSNPLQSIPGVERLVPPTPPPTPATGTSSSDDYTEGDIDDEEDDADDGDVNPYDDYSGPKPDTSAQNFPVQRAEGKEPDKAESENKKLLGDALIDLSDEGEEGEMLSSQDDSDEIDEPQKLANVWPPPGYTTEPEKPVSPVVEKKVRPAGGASVLRKWPPASGERVEEVKMPEVKKVNLPKGTKKKWPPDPEPEPEQPQLKPVKPVEQPKPVQLPPPVETKEKVEEKVERFVSLRPVKRQDPSASQSQERENELLKIKLKKASDKMGGVYSSPQSEVTSGAGDELKQRLLKRQKNAK